MSAKTAPATETPVVATPTLTKPTTPALSKLTVATPTLTRSTTPALPQPTEALPTEQAPTTPRHLRIDFDELRRVLKEKEPQKPKFLKSIRCRILVVIGVLLSTGVLAVVATAYTLAFTTATTTTTIVYQRTPIFQRVTQLNDPTIAICNATAGGTSLNVNVGTGVCCYPVGQGSAASIDFENTTYMNYGTVGLFGTPSVSAGIGTGLHTTPQAGPTIIQSIQFQTGNETASRDPLTVTLEGSNHTGTSLYSGPSWTLLYAGVTGLLPLNNSRLTWGELQNFSNTIPFTSYRIIVTSQRDADVGTEYAEMHLYGVF